MVGYRTANYKVCQSRPGLIASLFFGRFIPPYLDFHVFSSDRCYFPYGSEPIAKIFHILLQGFRWLLGNFYVSRLCSSSMEKIAWDCRTGCRAPLGRSFEQLLFPGSNSGLLDFDGFEKDRCCLPCGLVSIPVNVHIF